MATESDERITHWRDVDGNRFTARAYRDPIYGLPAVDIITADGRTARTGMLMDGATFAEWATNHQAWVPDEPADCEIVRIDRTDGTETRVAHDLTRELAERAKESMDGVRVHLMPDGTPRFRYAVREQGGGR